METMREKAAQMLRESEVVVLTSVNKEGYPRPVPMSMVKSEDISTVWMSTGSDSVKTEDFRKNPKGGLCFYAQGNSVCMTGDVEVITDQNVKQELWQDWFINHFPVNGKYAFSIAKHSIDSIYHLSGMLDFLF